MGKNHYVYPALFYYDEDGISIEFPDLPGCLSCASDSEEAFHNAKEALGLHLFGMEQDGDAIPAPSRIQDLHPEKDVGVALIEVFMPVIRDRINTKAVKKTLTIPTWLNREAEEAGANFSLILQDALKQYLGKATDNSIQKSEELSICLASYTFSEAKEYAEKSGVSLGQYVNDAVVAQNSRFSVVGYITPEIKDTAKTLRTMFCDATATSSDNSTKMPIRLLPPRKQLIQQVN